MRKQRIAKRKIGAILCYQRDASDKLKRDGSYLFLYDPDGRGADASPGESLLLHYLRICNAIGFWALVDGIRSALGLPAREGSMRPDDLQRFLRAIVERTVTGEPRSDARRRSAVALGRYGPGVTFEVRGQLYFGRAFRYEALLGLVGAEAPSPRPVTVLGLSHHAARALAGFIIRPNFTALEEALVGDDVRRRQEFLFQQNALLGPLYYAGLEDGTVRVDFTSLDQVLTENLDVAE